MTLLNKHNFTLMYNGILQGQAPGLTEYITLLFSWDPTRFLLQMNQLNKSLKNIDSEGRRLICEKMSKILNISLSKLYILIALWSELNDDNILDISRHESLFLDFIFDIYDRDNLIINYKEQNSNAIENLICQTGKNLTHTIVIRKNIINILLLRRIESLKKEIVELRNTNNILLECNSEYSNF